MGFNVGNGNYYKGINQYLDDNSDSLEELLTNILRLNVGVNQVAFIMKILETE